ncbi:MAG: hypothetical protein ACI854_000221 [Arenicella sp.]|jgi:hypothetical protein
MAQWLINIKHIDMPEVLAAIKDTVSGVWRLALHRVGCHLRGGSFDARNFDSNGLAEGK